MERRIIVFPYYQDLGENVTSFRSYWVLDYFYEALWVETLRNLLEDIPPASKESWRYYSAGKFNRQPFFSVYSVWWLNISEYFFTIIFRYNLYIVFIIYILYYNSILFHTTKNWIIKLYVLNVSFQRRLSLSFPK